MAENYVPGAVAGLTIMTVAEIPNLYSGFLPSLFTISTFSEQENQEHTRYWIRRGEILASVMALAVGAGASLLANNPLPLFGTLGMMAYLLWQYEHALRKGMTAGPGLSLKGGARNANGR